MSIISFGSFSSFWMAVLVIWTLIWKGIALWKAGTSKKKVWFIVLLVLNTVGILEILYIFIFSKEGETKDIGKIKEVKAEDIINNKKGEDGEKKK